MFLLGSICGSSLAISLGDVGEEEEEQEEKKSFAEGLAGIPIPKGCKLKELVFGNPNAPNIVIIYTSFTCPNCREFHLKEFPKFQKKCVDTGKAVVHVRNFLDDQGAVDAATLVACFGKNSSEKAHDLSYQIFKEQKLWMESSNPGQFLKKIFTDRGYSQAEIDACLENKKILAGLIMAHKLASQKFKIFLIPTIIINGKIYNGSLTYEEIDAALQPPSKGG
jgi:protein-disulfide isomerase